MEKEYSRAAERVNTLAMLCGAVFLREDEIRVRDVQLQPDDRRILALLDQLRLVRRASCCAHIICAE